jgi:hypothetical protein
VPAIATALGCTHLLRYLPKQREDYITSGVACLGCFDRRPALPWSVSTRYPDHAPLRASHPHLVKDGGQGVRFYHSVASCPFLWRKVHIFVRANMDRTDLFQHTTGAAPPTQCVAVVDPIQH